MKGASTSTPLMRRYSGHESTASDLRGNRTAVTAAPPRSPSGRADDVRLWGDAEPERLRCTVRVLPLCRPELQVGL